MNKLFLITFLLFVFSFSLQSYARDNPFIAENPEKDSNIKLPAIATGIIGKIMIWQEELNIKLTRQVKMLKNDNSFRNLLPLVIISFLYGIVHAAGPGHGKVVVFSYFVSKKANLKKGMFLGFLISILHAFSGILIVLTLFYMLKTTYLTSFENISKYIKVVSYSLVLLIGLLMLINSLFNIIGRLFSEKNGSPNSENVSDSKNILTIALAVGIVPCPGVVIIMLFALSFNLLTIGLTMSMLMAFGMAVTIMIAGLISILGRNGLLKSAARGKNVQQYFRKGLSVFGSLLIIFFGGTLLLGVL